MNRKCVFPGRHLALLLRLRRNVQLRFISGGGGSSNGKNDTIANDSTSQQQSDPWHFVPERVEYARLGNGRCWEFRTGSMARFASGSVVLSTDEDNAMLGTLVCKYKEPLDEEELLKDILIAPIDGEQDEAEKMTAAAKEGAEDNSVGERTQKTSSIPQQGGELAFTVDYRQSAAAIGRIPSNYFRREMNNSEQNVAISRAVDRSLRPIIPKQFPARVHVVCKPLALDTNGDITVMAINAASAALAVSPVPQQCIVAAARVGLLDGQIAVNPPRERLRARGLDLLLTGTLWDDWSNIDDQSQQPRQEQRVIMVEMEGAQLDTEHFVECVRLGFDEIQLTFGAIQRLADSVGCRKHLFHEPAELSNDLLEKVSICEDSIIAVLTDYSHDKVSRRVALDEIYEGWRLLVNRTHYDPKYNDNILQNAFYALAKRVHRRLVLDTGLRVDGRRTDEFRPIKCRVDLYRKLHGSALFQRGQSQVLSTVTFDSPQAAFHPDAIAQLLGAQRKKTFMLHYEFPQFSTNELETGVMMSNRREMGHGLLAEKALHQVVPDEFPYTVRLACQVLESNGSTSMASVSAGSLALFDAGVPLKANHVAGVAMGLMTRDESERDQQGHEQPGSEGAEQQEEDNENKMEEEEHREEDTNEFNDATTFSAVGPDFGPGNYQLLTDITGLEDYTGDMDFKVAGTSRGFTAMQMDLKICGLPLAVFTEALHRAKLGIEHVLVQMRETIAEPRSEFKPTVPIIELLPLPLFKRSLLFRSGAYNAKLIEAETGVTISNEDDTNISLFAPNRECLDRAKTIIEKLIQEEQQEELYQFGAVYKAQIVRLVDSGVQVTLREGGKPVFMRNSDLSNAPGGRQNAYGLGLKVGQLIPVQYFGRDQHTGQHRVSRKTLQLSDSPVQNLFGKKSAKEEHSSESERDGKEEGHHRAGET